MSNKKMNENDRPGHMKTKQLSFSFPPPKKETRKSNVVNIETKIKVKPASKKTNIRNDIIMRFIKHSESLDW